jgi:hypothetical protein
MIEGGAAMPVVVVPPAPETGLQRRFGPRPSGRVPGGQGSIALPPAPPPALPEAPGPVVPVPGTVLPVPVVPGMAELPDELPGAVGLLGDVPIPDVLRPEFGEPTTAALLPLRPVAPIPAPVLLPVVPPAPPVWAMAMQDPLTSNAAATGKILSVFMGNPHVDFNVD